MPYFDRLDIVEAHYLFLSEHYNGQTDPRYARLCRLTSPTGPFRYHPKPNLNARTLSPNGRAIYRALVEKERRWCRERERRAAISMTQALDRTLLTHRVT